MCDQQKLTQSGLFIHGGQINAVMASFPNAPRPFIDLSTGISPFPYPFTPPSPNTLYRLPQKKDEQQLKEDASYLWRLPKNKEIVLAPGSQILISLLPYILRPKKIFILSPTYSGHVTSWENAGFDITHIAHFQELHHAAQAQNSLCILCNPNNPTGDIYSAQQIEQLALRCQATHSLLVIDEAYCDFCDAHPHHISPAENQINLRSFGKGYGLPGLRLGFMAARPSITSQMEKILGPWSVSSFALKIGHQALKDENWIKNASTLIQKSAQRLRQILKDFHYKSFGKAHLFTYFQANNGFKLWKYFAEHGILLRFFPEKPNFLRIGLPADEESWRRIEKCFSSYRSDKG